MNFSGLDIGGANIKLATIGGNHRQIPFPIWKDKTQLPIVLESIKATLPSDSILGVTMTAELADCFASKSEGVKFVAESVNHVFQDFQVLYYRTDGSMCDNETAIRDWRFVAASNWHANAWMVFQDTDDPSGFLVDVGSTTTDIIPVHNRQPVINGQSDIDRLTNGQLVYAGVGRTPLCSLLSEIEFANTSVSIAREFFATMSDALLWLGKTVTDETNRVTADGRPFTRVCAGQRLARMLCADMEELGFSKIDEIAKQAKASLQLKIERAIHQVVDEHQDLPPVFRVCGEGADLAVAIIQSSFANPVDADVLIHRVGTNLIQDQTAPALAVALKRQAVYLENEQVKLT